MAIEKKAVKKPKARKSPIKKVVKKKAPKKKTQAMKTKTAVTGLKVIGKVTHFFPHVSAGVVMLSGDLKTGDMIQIKGHTTDLKQTIDSMQIDRAPVAEAKKGQEIGLKVKDRVRIGDTVYKL